MGANLLKVGNPTPPHTKNMRSSPLFYDSQNKGRVF